MTTVLVVVLVLLLLLAALRLWLTARRLDRLHSRTEAAWTALQRALSRRIDAARAVADSPGLEPAAAALLRGLADSAGSIDPADPADRAARADAENDLSRGLATLTAGAEPGRAAEVADAAERVVLARRFYNDAVRDTRALRAVPFTRMFRLAGHAPLPDFFEITEARPDRPAAAAGEPIAAPVVRTAARVVLLDRDDRVLLLAASDPDSNPRRWWMTPGGGVEDGEELAAAAIRELAEETGLALADGDLVGPIWRRTARFVFTGVDYEQTEYYFAARPPHSAPDPGHPAAGRPVDGTGLDGTGLDGAGLDGTGLDGAGLDRVDGPPGADAPAVNGDRRTALEREVITGSRWWAGADMSDSVEHIYPLELADRLPEVRAALAAGRPPGTVVEVL